MADKELMELIARKPERGLELLIKRYSGLVFSVVRGRLAGLCPAEDIEECVSDTFISFYRSMAGFDPQKGSMRWCAPSTSNTALAARSGVTASTTTGP